MKYLLISILFVGCGEGKVIVKPEPITQEHSFCTYDIDNICVMEDNRFADIDPETLSWSLNITEEYFNLFYPGLNLSSLSESEGFKIHYRFANINTKYQGEYSNLETTAYIYLRTGDGITDRIKCMDKYYIAMHEVLHFINSRYLEYDITIDYLHMVPHVFYQWESQTSVEEHREWDQTNIIEGLIYYDISNMCGY